MDAPSQDAQREIIFDFIASHALGILSTISSSGFPCSAPVYTRVKSSLICYFSTRTNTEKYENILQNQNVALTIVDETTLQTVQLRGIASILTNNDEIRDAMESLRNIVSKEKPKWMSPEDKISRGAFKFDVSRWVPPIGQLSGGSYVYIQIRPLWLRYRRYDSDWKTGKKYTEYLIEERVTS